MTTPLVTVLLPVYNAERYLREAIGSVLQQTFTDFELLAINDGSTDSSEAIVLSFGDERIRYISNKGNKGLIYTLNRGIELARGQYIARMDGDDICHPQRLEKQVAYLQQSSVALVASTVEMISENGSPLPPWKDDRQHTTPQSIRAFLLRDNCIAHPSIMARTEVMREYRYQSDQKEAEDYDLWLRLSADGQEIAKINEPLLRYRFLQTSLTRKEGLSAFERLSRTKSRFLAQRRKEGRMNAWCYRLSFYCALDTIRARVKSLLRR